LLSERLLHVQAAAASERLLHIQAAALLVMEEREEQGCCCGRVAGGAGGRGRGGRARGGGHAGAAGETPLDLFMCRLILEWVPPFGVEERSIEGMERDF
jgi:hypothetical protein